MALSYFKFNTEQWITGSIAVEDYAVQGLFINICALYWGRKCELTYKSIVKMLKGDDTLYKTLLESDILKQDEQGNISIRFLDEQFEEDKLRAKIASENGKKGGRGKNKDNIITVVKKEVQAVQPKPLTEIRKKDFVNVSDYRNCQMYEYNEMNEEFKKMYSENVWNSWKLFNKHIDDNCEFIRMIEKQIQIHEYVRLKTDFIDTRKITVDRLKEKLSDFNNYKPAREKYNSVYVAFNGWLKMEINR